jgi:hypothetical protein
MPESSTTVRVIKGPREASQLLGIQYFNQSPNCPTRLPREPRRSHATHREGEPFSQMIHSPFNHDNGTVYKATDWAPNSPRTQKTGHLPSFPRAGTRSVTTTTARCDPLSSPGGPTRSAKDLEGITHPSKASGAAPGRCARTHPTDSFLQKTQINCNEPKQDDEGPHIPLRSAKEREGDNTTAKRPSSQALTMHRGLEASPASRPSEWSRPRARGLPTRPAVIRKTPYCSIKTLKGITHPSKALGATPAGCARAHPPDSPLLTQNKSKATHGRSFLSL